MSIGAWASSVQKHYACTILAIGLAGVFVSLVLWVSLVDAKINRPIGGRKII